MAGLDGLQRPPLDALIPRLVDRDELIAASALDSFRGNVGMLAGPGGRRAPHRRARAPSPTSSTWSRSRVSLGALALMRAVPPPPDAKPPSLRQHRRGHPLRVEPAGAARHLQRGHGRDVLRDADGPLPRVRRRVRRRGVLGLLYAAPSFGSLLATATSGWTGRVHRHGLAVHLGRRAGASAIVGFGLAHEPAARPARAGRRRRRRHAQRHLPLDDLEPDDPRPPARAPGRDRADQLLDRPVARATSRPASSRRSTSVRASIVSGGVLCVVGVAVAALALPAFRRYDARVFEAERAAELTPAAR